MKVTTFWNIATCSPTEVIEVSEVRSASIIRETLKRRYTSMRLYGAVP
jgi:hypothetical protein